ncbi:MAG: replication-associated recombination protein A [Brevinema sp.]
MSLFGNKPEMQPLALRMAPQTFDTYEGQELLVGENGIIKAMVARKMVQSMLFYGPPASGKTGLARLIAKDIDAEYLSVNALTLSSDDIREIIKKANNFRDMGRRTVLFIDEIHRLTRPKQDAFLSAVEMGIVILIGATTENPYFALQPALRSRMLVFEFKALEKSHLKKILYRAIDHDHLLKEIGVSISDDAAEFLVAKSTDPRSMLGILEGAVLRKNVGSYEIVKKDIEEILQRSDTRYGDDEAHYNTISAFIKSIRGSDPDATLYYLAIMIESGEDPRFIFRRLLISAVEDIGLAAPDAITVVQACAEAFEYVGYPEGILHLSHAALFLAGLPKSNSVLNIYDAMSAVKQGLNLGVPESLQNKHYPSANGARESSHFNPSYLYPHDYEGHFVQQQYMVKPVNFYHPSLQGVERKIVERLEKLWDKTYPKNEGKSTQQ